ncbi:hypothetical protein [Pseudaestuariivita rosea]|uniref:hypothetical protein n=1 Tax=Pseudaestuariivita rosea TaxID=2763263 RepID=UPI001ABAD37C|nr:hypothetical protein [Pseudaestuariivita rosea]
MNLYFRAALVVLSFSALSACNISISNDSSDSPSANLDFNSRLQTPSAEGEYPDDRNDYAEFRSGRVNNNGNGFAYQVGRVSGTDDIVAVAGVLPTTTVGSAPTEASATYDGEYQMTIASETGSRSDPIRIRNEEGRITLNADFTRQTLTSTSGDLQVDGTIDGQTVGGTVTHSGVTANMAGSIGADRVVTAFSGDNGRTAIVGGILANRDR